MKPPAQGHALNSKAGIRAQAICLRAQALPHPTTLVSSPGTPAALLLPSRDHFYTPAFCHYYKSTKPSPPSLQLFLLKMQCFVLLHILFF